MWSSEKRSTSFRNEVPLILTEMAPQNRSEKFKQIFRSSCNLSKRNASEIHFYSGLKKKVQKSKDQGTIHVLRERGRTYRNCHLHPPTTKSNQIESEKGGKQRETATESLPTKFCTHVRKNADNRRRCFTRAPRKRAAGNPPRGLEWVRHTAKGGRLIGDRQSVGRQPARHTDVSSCFSPRFHADPRRRAWLLHEEERKDEKLFS